MRNQINVGHELIEYWNSHRSLSNSSCIRHHKPVRLTSQPNGFKSSTNFYSMHYVPLRLLMFLSALSFLEPKKILINQTLSLLEKEEYVGYLMKVDTIEIRAKMTVKNITLTVVVSLLLLPRMRGTHHTVVVKTSLVCNTLFFPGSLLGFSSPKTWRVASWNYFDFRTPLSFYGQIEFLNQSPLYTAKLKLIYRMLGS